MSRHEPPWEYMRIIFLCLHANGFVCFWSFFNVALETNFQGWHTWGLSFETLKAVLKLLKTRNHEQKQISEHKTPFYEFGRNKQRVNMISPVRHGHNFSIRLLITQFPQMILIRSITEDVSALAGPIFLFFSLCPLVVNYTNACCLHKTKRRSLPTWHCKFNVTFIIGGGSCDPQNHLQTNIWQMKWV